jgi:hypothetical protein
MVLKTTKIVNHEPGNIDLLSSLLWGARGPLNAQIILQVEVFKHSPITDQFAASGTAKSGQVAR